MPDPGPPSEFGGKIQTNRVFPPVDPVGNPGHVPTTAERLMLTYTTGGEDSTKPPDDGSAWEGLEEKTIVLQVNRFPGS